LEAVRGDLNNVKVDVDGDPDRGEGSIGRVSALRSPNGIVDSSFRAANRIGVIRATGERDPATPGLSGGNFHDSTARADELGRVVVTGRIADTDDADGESIRATRGSFVVADADDRVRLNEGDSQYFDGILAMSGQAHI
jgi:hypothetical protein